MSCTRSENGSQIANIYHILQLPSKRRKTSLATSAAETFITIPDIGHVFETGSENYSIYTPIPSSSKLATSYVNQGQAMQRAGRVGRTRPGHFYALYPCQIFQSMKLTAVPQFQTSNFTSMAMKMIVQTLDPFQFPWLHGPSDAQIYSTWDNLHHYECIEFPSQPNVSPTGTPAGQFISTLVMELGMPTSLILPSSMAPAPQDKPSRDGYAPRLGAAGETTNPIGAQKLAYKLIHHCRLSTSVFKQLRQKYCKEFSKVQWQDVVEYFRPNLVGPYNDHRSVPGNHLQRARLPILVFKTFALNSTPLE